MIVLLEPPAPPGFVSGGYRYQQRVFEQLAATGRGRRQGVVPAELDGVVSSLRRDDRVTTIVVDGLFAELAGPLPARVVALLHMLPGRRPWSCAPLPAIATSARTAAQVAASCAAVTVVRPGVDGCFRRSPCAPLPGAVLRIAVVGTLCDAKGQLRLIRTLARCERSDWQLELIGSDGERDQVAAVRAAAAGLPVRCHGPLSSDALADVLATCDLLVSMSRDESFGMAAVEAATMGIPVLAFDTGEIATFVRDGENGWLLPVDAPDEAVGRRIEGLLRCRDALASRRGRVPPVVAADLADVAEAFAAACEAFAC